MRGLTTLYSSRSLHNYIQWYFGNLCNASCSYCLNAWTLEHYQRNMTLDESMKTVEFVNSVPGVYHVSMIGGEPSLFDHCLWAAERIRKPVVSILTNGLDADFVRRFMRLGVRGHQVIVCMSLHYELYLANPNAYTKSIDAVVDAVEGNPFVRLEVTPLLDGVKSAEYSKLLEKVVDEHAERGYHVNVSYVRRSYDAAEFVRSYAAVNLLPEHIRPFVRKRLAAERLDVLRPSPFFGKPCPMFDHYLYIDIDGTLRSSDCPQAVRSAKSIFADNFDLSEVRRSCQCAQRHAKNNSSCELVHGLFK